MKLWFSGHIFDKVIKYQMSLKYIQWEPSSMRAGGRTDGRTDMTKLVVPFHKFENAPKKRMEH